MLLLLSSTIAAACLLFSLVSLRRRRAALKSSHCGRREDWPDVPVAALALFRQEGRINQPMEDPRGRIGRLPRVATFFAAQGHVMHLVSRNGDRHPTISLQLSDTEGEDWTEIHLNGLAVALVPTHALTTRHDLNGPMPAARKAA